MNKLSSLINSFYRHPILAKTFHTLVNCLQNELSNCESVLDLGCGPDSPLQYCNNIKYSVGVEIFKPYLEESKRKKIHTKYLNKDIKKVNFSENSFDAVIMIEVLEHLSKLNGEKILKNAEKWAKKKVIITTPNGFWHQKELDNNLWQSHLSGWFPKDFYQRDYRVSGLSGCKFLRRESENDTMKNDLLSPVRFRPKMFWFCVLTVSQVLVYRFPKLAFELFCVKRV